MKAHWNEGVVWLAPDLRCPSALDTHEVFEHSRAPAHLSRLSSQDLGVEGALALLSKPAKADQPDDQSASGDWIAFRSAIDEMRDELVAVRGVLQESA